MAVKNLEDHIKNNKFAPTIHEIVKKNDEVIRARKKEWDRLEAIREEEHRKLCVPPPWKALGITMEEYRQQLLLEEGKHE